MLNNAKFAVLRQDSDSWFIKVYNAFKVLLSVKTPWEKIKKNVDQLTEAQVCVYTQHTWRICEKTFIWPLSNSFHNCNFRWKNVVHCFTTVGDWGLGGELPHQPTKHLKLRFFCENA